MYVSLNFETQTQTIEHSIHMVFSRAVVRR
jgi:hypothetical protein